MSATVIGDYTVGPGGGSSLLTDLVAFWKLEEASGTRVDEAGNNDLSDNNTVTQAAGKIGNAAQFTATNTEWLSVASNTDLQTGTIDFTFTCWVWLSTGGSLRSILSKYPGADREFLLWWYDSDSQFRWTVGNSTVTVIASNFGAASRETWYFIAAWRDSVNNQIGISINNGTANTTGLNEATVVNNGDFNIGNNEGAVGYADGRIDAVGFWKRLLTADEKTALYNSGNGIEYPFS